MMSSIAIFCGSAPGKDSVFVENARKVGETLAAQGKTLIYGGGRSGLMGVVADSALAGRWACQLVSCLKVWQSMNWRIRI